MPSTSPTCTYPSSRSRCCAALTSWPCRRGVWRSSGRLNAGTITACLVGNAIGDAAAVGNAGGGMSCAVGCGIGGAVGLSPVVGDDLAAGGALMGPAVCGSPVQAASRAAAATKAINRCIAT
jgi:hypothetical protein